ncbi:sodium-coupled monocarboxylate transporter 1-like [Acanthaster planci]|uniref:Sodium-coupled monocarboxylate transporter 1-like n=1 Tax=Acanthaster planci TaxID=133434 RepID=A0A8B7Y8I1_ACAPL|nr:sodium-coupled monocarboxylate transporter 1-like [Acanthaster planci]
MAVDDTQRLFQVWDYVVFGLMLAVSVFIGIYYGCTGGKQKTTKEFLLADRNMNPIPVAMSLVASFISAITVLGTPAETYIYGTMFWLFGFAYILTGIAVTRLFLPVFYRLGVTSANEYLEKRFNKVVRVAGTLTYFLQMVLYMGIVIYAPALAFNAVTNLSLWGSVVAIGVACTFYTTVGGMKAVLWTDAFQMCVMMAGFLAVIIEGSLRLGGFIQVWKIAEEGGRIDFWNFSPDPSIRHTFWSVVVGGCFTWTATYGVNQSQVQRYLTVGNLRRSRISLYLATVGMVIVVSCACSAGLVMYSYYANQRCDPYTSNQIDQTDQLIPIFVMELFGGLPGLPGLFTSSVFSAALSTVSSGLNSLAAVTAEDLVRPCFKKMQEERYTLVTKGIAMGFGLLSLLVAYIVSLLNKGVLQLALSLFGMTGGPLMGVFSLGMFFPWSNSKGALTGLICGLAMAFWVGIGAQIYPPEVYKPPLVIDGCYSTNATNSTFGGMGSTAMSGFTTMPPTEEPRPAIAALYTLSYSWYSCTYWLITVVVGLLVSFLTGANKSSDNDPMLYQHIADACYCCLPEVIKKPMRCGQDKLEYEDDDDTKDTAYCVKEVDGVKTSQDFQMNDYNGVGTITNMKYIPKPDNPEENTYDNPVEVYSEQPATEM